MFWVEGPPRGTYFSLIEYKLKWSSICLLKIFIFVKKFMSDFFNYLIWKQNCCHSSSPILFLLIIVHFVMRRYMLAWIIYKYAQEHIYFFLHKITVVFNQYQWITWRIHHNFLYRSSHWQSLGQIFNTAKTAYIWLL